MTRQMAGAYMGPLLELIESMTRTMEDQGKLLLDVMESRGHAHRELGDLIAACEQSQALPAWMIERAKKIHNANQGAKHGA